MNNPLASPHFRAESQMGDYFRVIREVHANLKELKLLASHFHAVRSGNVELAIDDNLDFKYKYQLGNEWYVMANMTDLFSPFQVQINGINAKLVLIDSQLTDLSGIISTINDKISGIEQYIADNEVAIAAISTEATAAKDKAEANEALIDANKVLIDAQDVIIGQQATNISNLNSQLVTLAARVTALEQAPEQTP